MGFMMSCWFSFWFAQEDLFFDDSTNTKMEFMGSPWGNEAW
jgi:hypothetical protein